MATRPNEALSIAQCVAKRRGQLERLEFVLEATARRLCSAASSSSSSAASASGHKHSPYSANAQTQTLRSYAQLLLETLKKEAELQQLFASATPLEEFAEMMPRLLELRDEEDHVAQRTDVVWRVIRGRTSSVTPASSPFTTAANVDDATREILAQCELKWLALVYGSAYLDPVITRVQEVHEKTQHIERPFARWEVSSSIDADRVGRHRNVLVPESLFSIRPRVVVNHRLAWASLTAKTTH